MDDHQNGEDGNQEREECHICSCPLVRVVIRIVLIIIGLVRRVVELAI